MNAFYNEIEPYAADWLCNLQRAGHIAAGTIDRRSIVELQPQDLGGFDRHHFFAGIGGWDFALRLADWPATTPVWTGSCPCQPFSIAGSKYGFDDSRHLWPAWFRLIDACRPPIVFGEQVAAPNTIGRAQRSVRADRRGPAKEAFRPWVELVQADLEGAGYTCGFAVLPAAGVGAPHGRHRLFFAALGHPDDPRLQGRRLRGDGTGERPAGPAGLVSNFWSDADWIPCRDPKRGTVHRPVEPGTFPLAYGIPARVGRLRAYGNAIVPQVASEFIQAAMKASRYEPDLDKYSGDLFGRMIERTPKQIPKVVPNLPEVANATTCKG